MPPGVPSIIANEAAEHFSFYRIRAILAVFMIQYLMNSAGQPDTMAEAGATVPYHLFISAVYFTPVPGRYRPIIALSLVYFLGHHALALDDTRMGLGLGIFLIALGAGGIKPCVSARGRPVRTDEQSPSAQGIRLVLFRHQSRSIHVDPGDPLAA